MNMTAAQIRQCSRYLSRKQTNSIIPLTDLVPYLGSSIMKAVFPLKKINDDLKQIGDQRIVILVKGGNIRLAERFPKTIKTNCVKTKKTMQQDKDAILREARENMLHKQLLMSVCSILEKMNIYEKLYKTEIQNRFPTFKDYYLSVDEINNVLHPKGKEVTALNGYFVLCEVGFHEQRMKDLEPIRYSQNSLYEPEGYRDDISNTNGTYHLRRDITGRIASSPDEDSYDDW